MKRWMIIAALLSFCFVSCDNGGEPVAIKEAKSVLKQDDKKDKKKKDKKKDKNGKDDIKKKKDHSSGSVAMLDQWDMPDVLTEVSGIAWYGNNKIAAVQDEAGVVFIYDLVSKKIEKEIPFSGKGDYEGVAVAGSRIFVLRSDGVIFEISGNDERMHRTHLSAAHDTEGLCFDRKNNRLLVSVKAGDPSTPASKGIYSFDLSSMKLSAEPVMKVDLEHPLLGGGKKISERFQPSEIAVHPVTGDVYLTDGPNPSLLIMSSEGTIKEYHKLDRSVFKQPEGITFSPGGDVFISSEGVKQNGVIVKVELDNQKEEAI